MEEHGAAMAAGPSYRISPIRKACFLLAPLILLLLGCEGLLWVLDLGDPDDVPLRGFDPAERYLQADPAVPGGYVTHMFEHAQREVTVPPKGAACRVVLIGGSNTQILPETVLRLLLERDDEQGRSWEVFNLGREGFGSGRAGRVLAQSLALDPDVILVYSGHNEFVELAYERELDDLWNAPWQRAMVAALSKLRLYNALTATMKGPEQDWTELGEPTAEPRQLKGLTLLRMPYTETLELYASYRVNLQAMARAAAERGVPLVLCSLVGNLLSPPHVDVEADELSPDVRQESERLRLAAVGLIAPRWRAGLRPPVRLRLGSWYSGTPRSESAQPPRLRTLGGPLALAPELQVLKARSVEGAHWPEPSDWDESVWQVVEGMESIHERHLSDDERERLERAVELLVEARELTPLSPTVHFDLGLCLYLLGEDDGAAVAALRRAADLDHAPGKAGDLSNGIVREVAAGEAGVTLLDAAALFTGRCPSELPGYEVLMDRCHLQPGARVVLMQDMADTILSLELP